MAEDPRVSDWYFTRQDAPVRQKSGPCSWEQPRALANAGALNSADLVWHPTLPAWIVAEQVVGLLPAKAGPAPPPSAVPQERKTAPVIALPTVEALTEAGPTVEESSVQRAIASRRRLLLVVAMPS
jgi:hypothetical protein